MRTPRSNATLALCAVLLMIPGRWAVAEPGKPAPAQTLPDVENSTPDGGSRANVDIPASPLERSPLLRFNRRSMEPTEFYEAVGRPDLADKVRSRRLWAFASRAVGGSLLVSGALGLALAVYFSGWAAPPCDGAVPQECYAHNSPWPLAVVAGAGLALLVAPVLWTNDPVSDDENERLSSAAERRARRAPGWSLSAGPAPTGQGGALSFVTRF
jgi:hypothetical protein